MTADILKRLIDQARHELRKHRRDFAGDPAHAAAYVYWRAVRNGLIQHQTGKKGGDPIQNIIRGIE